MKLGLTIGELGPEAALPMDIVLEAERLGYDSVWTSETWGADAPTQLGYLAAKTSRIKLGTNILQMQSRAPTLAANTMTTIDKLSGGRAMVGLGLSGPQVIEGWYGVPYGRPAKRVREYVQIMRQVWARENPLTFDGDEYQLPYMGEGATGLGKPLRSILHPRDLPVYLGAIGPVNIRQAAQFCDGWIAARFSPKKKDLWFPHLEEGFRRAGNGKSFRDFDVMVTTRVIIGDDVQACLAELKPNLALYIGGMGARTKNFHNQQAREMGYAEAAERIQELYLAGRRGEAIEAVPDELCDELSLCGPEARIRERFRDWEDAGVTTMTLSAPLTTTEALHLMADISGVAKGAAA